MVNTDEPLENERFTSSRTEDDAGGNIVIEKDETLIAKTTRSGDDVTYGHQCDPLSNQEVQYEVYLFQEEEDDDNDYDDDDDEDGQTKYEYLNDSEII